MATNQARVPNLVRADRVWLYRGSPGSPLVAIPTGLGDLALCSDGRIFYAGIDRRLRRFVTNPYAVFRPLDETKVTERWTSTIWEIGPPQEVPRSWLLTRSLSKARPMAASKMVFMQLSVDGVTHVLEFTGFTLFEDPAVLKVARKIPQLFGLHLVGFGLQSAHSLLREWGHNRRGEDVGAIWWAVLTGALDPALLAT